MVAEVGKKRIKQATESFGRLVDHYGDTRAGIKKVAELLETTPRKVRYQYGRCMNGEDISGELLGRMLSLTEKSQAFSLKIDDPDLLEHTSALLKKARKEMAAKLKEEYEEHAQALDEHKVEMEQREATLAQREAALTTEMEMLESDRRKVNLALEERFEEVVELERQFEARRLGVRVREERVAVREKRTNKWEIIREEFTPGGFLSPDPGKSLARVHLEFEEAHNSELGRWYGQYAKRRRIDLERKEKTFNIVAGPLRKLIYKIAEMS